MAATSSGRGIYFTPFTPLDGLIELTPIANMPRKPFSLDSFNNVPDELWDWVWESGLGSTAFPSELRENAPAGPFSILLV
ncbi:C1 [Grapevine geminivirus A defective DNA]|nr:C1 [Grapevine geminivirus A defective DNA]